MAIEQTELNPPQASFTLVKSFSPTSEGYDLFLEIGGYGIIAVKITLNSEKYNLPAILNREDLVTVLGEIPFIVGGSVGSNKTITLDKDENEVSILSADLSNYFIAQEKVKNYLALSNATIATLGALLTWHVEGTHIAIIPHTTDDGLVGIHPDNIGPSSRVELILPYNSQRGTPQPVSMYDTILTRLAPPEEGTI